MDMIGNDPVLNLNDEKWRIYARHTARAPQYVGSNGVTERSTITEGCKIYGTVRGSVLGPGVTVAEGASVIDSVIMEDVTVKSGAKVYSAIVDSDTVVEFGGVVGKENADKSEIAIVAKGTTVFAERRSK